MIRLAVSDFYVDQMCWVERITGIEEPMLHLLHLSRFLYQLVACTIRALSHQLRQLAILFQWRRVAYGFDAIGRSIVLGTYVRKFSSVKEGSMGTAPPSIEPARSSHIQNRS